MVVGLMHVLLVLYEGYSSNWIHIRVASLVYREERAILCGHISPLSLLITAIFSALVWSEQLSWGRFVASS